MKLTVQCTFDVEVEFDGDLNSAKWAIEENSCPGTGPVGSAIEAMIEDSRTCWACPSGKNKIVAVDGKPIA